MEGGERDERSCLSAHAQLFLQLPWRWTAGLGQSKYTFWPRMRPQCRYCGWISDDVKEFHASLIRCLMFDLVRGPEARTGCRQRLNRELSGGEGRFAAAVGILITSVNSWQPQSWKVSRILSSLWIVALSRPSRGGWTSR